MLQQTYSLRYSGEPGTPAVVVLHRFGIAEVLGVEAKGCNGEEELTNAQAEVDQVEHGVSQWPVPEVEAMVERN